MSRHYFKVGQVVGHVAGIVGPDRIRRSFVGAIVGIDAPCEHCDGERSDRVRHDELRGFVCPDCDSALDEMLDEIPLCPVCGKPRTLRKPTTSIVTPECQCQCDLNARSAK